jgi:hypothetical protein
MDLALQLVFGPLMFPFALVPADGVLLPLMNVVVASR